MEDSRTHPAGVAGGSKPFQLPLFFLLTSLILLLIISLNLLARKQRYHAPQVSRAWHCILILS
jgi:hypothetical protein